jgi:epoxyqueuosine reductase
MKLSNITNLILERLKQNGWQGKIVSIEHLRDLEEEIETHRQNGLLDEELNKAYLDRFDFNVSAYFEGAQTLIVVSAPQPQQRVIFNRNGRVFPCIIPPTYSLDTDGRIKDCLNDILKPLDYRLEKKRLPEKLLSVHSGLARYGKNNITYVPGMGSFHRPAVFATDLPCAEDSWGESKPLNACGECTACMDACPTGAIVPHRFLVHAERCITFHNERRPDFPQWLDPSWHNSLVGCMICQNVCPMNQKLLNWIEDGAAFSEKETDYLFKGVPPDDMPKTMVEKLEKLGMTEYVDVLERNLKAIIKNQ